MDVPLAASAPQRAAPGRRRILSSQTYKNRRSKAKLYDDNTGGEPQDDTDHDAEEIKDDDVYVSLRKHFDDLSTSEPNYSGLSVENVERVRLIVRRYAERRKSSRAAIFDKPLSASSSPSTSHEISTIASERDDDAMRKQEVFRKRLAQIFGEEGSGVTEASRAAQNKIMYPSRDVELCGHSVTIPGWVIQAVPHTIVPQSYGYIMWLAVITCAFLYNAFAIPLRTLFDVQTVENCPYWLLADYICDGLYLIDMLGVRPLLKFVRHGIYVDSRAETALNYVSSQLFLIDLLALIPFDLLYFSIGHVVPALRLLRMLKVHCYWEFFDRVETIASIPNVLRIFKTIMYMLYLVHINSGLYYSISYYERIIYNNTNEWVFVDTDQRNAYVGCFYQALKMAIKIGHNPIPFNSRQRAFHTFSLLMGIFVFAILVGQIRDIYTSISAREAQFRRKLDMTIRYLQKLKIPHHTTEKVRAWFIYNWKFQKTLDENDFLEILPRKLKTDLAVNVHYNTIAKVTLFQDVEQGLISELVLMLRPRLYLPGEYVCRRGEVGTEMFIIKYGLVDVVGGANDTTVLATLGEGTVIGEIALLSLGGDNRRTAHVRSKGISQLFVLSKTDLETALLDYPTAQDILKKKARTIIRQNEKKRREQAAKQEPQATSSNEQTQLPQQQPALLHKKKISVISNADQTHGKSADNQTIPKSNTLPAQSKPDTNAGGSDPNKISSIFARLLPRADALRLRFGGRSSPERVTFRMTESTSTPIFPTSSQSVGKAEVGKAGASSARITRRRMMRGKTIVRPSVLKAMHYAAASPVSRPKRLTSPNESLNEALLWRTHAYALDTRAVISPTSTASEFACPHDVNEHAKPAKLRNNRRGDLLRHAKDERDLLLRPSAHRGDKQPKDSTYNNIKSKDAGQSRVLLAVEEPQSSDDSFVQMVTVV